MPRFHSNVSPKAHVRRLTLSDIYQLMNLEKLRLICYDNDGFGEIRRLKKMLSNVQIDDHNGNMRIATPYVMTGDHYGFWEINAKQEELFKVHMKQDQPLCCKKIR